MSKNTTDCNKKGTLNHYIRTTDKSNEYSNKPFSARTPRLIVDNSMEEGFQKKNILTKAKTNHIRDSIEEILRCSSDKRRSDLINGVIESFNLQKNEINSLKVDNEKLLNRVKELEEEITQQREDALRANDTNARFSKLKHLKSTNDIQKLINEIELIEKDCRKYINLSEPWLLDDLKKLNSENILDLLLNLKFRRLEDLVFGLRKQIVQDQEIVSIMPTIINRFGSVRVLLAKYYEAVEIINKLKVREYRLVSDELVKRRPLSEYDINGLHSLIIALQNELSEDKQLIRKYFLKPIETDANSEDEMNYRFYLNELEAKYTSLKENYEKVLKDCELFQSVSRLETDVLSNGLFQVEQRLKAKITESEERILKYHENLKKLNNTISMQNEIISQLQKEKFVALRKTLGLKAQFECISKRIETFELRAIHAEKSLKAVRSFSRIILDEFLINPQIIENEVIEKYCQCDSAARIIQRSWKKLPNSNVEKDYIKNLPIVLPMFEIERFIGTIPPIKYQQVVKLLKDFSLNMSMNVNKTLIEFSHGMKNMIDLSKTAYNKVLCVPRKYKWIQTEDFRKEIEIQTDKLPQTRTKK